MHMLYRKYRHRMYYNVAMDIEQPKTDETGESDLNCIDKCVDMLKGEDSALASRCGTYGLYQDCPHPSQGEVTFLRHTQKL